MSAATNPTRDALDLTVIAQCELDNAALAYRVASVRRRHAVQRAVALGATHREVADVLGVSRVKVTQLVNQEEEDS